MSDAQVDVATKCTDSSQSNYPLSMEDRKRLENREKTSEIMKRMLDSPYALYTHHELASVAEFNAYRIDLDIAIVVYRGNILIYSDGSPRYFLTIDDLRNLIEWGTLNTIAKVIDEPPLFWTHKRDAAYTLLFLYRSLMDRLPEEKKTDENGKTAFYVAFRKERDSYGLVETKMWFDSYDPHRVSEWQHTSPLLNIDNKVFKPSQTNIFNDIGSRGFVFGDKRTTHSEGSI